MKSFGAIAGRRLPQHMTARLASWGVRPGALVWQPAPPVTGDPSIAHRLSRGVLLFEGRLVESLEPTPWTIKPPEQVWSDQLHGHGWLDHAAASEDPAIWAHFANWVWDWIDRFTDATGPGWEPEIVARRLTRWIAHSVRLLNGQPSERSQTFFQLLAVQACYVDWRWRETREGAEQIEALCGLVYACLSLEGSGKRSLRAISDLGREAGRLIAADGTIASRSPEELARVLALLAWARGSIEDAGMKPAREHEEAIRRATPVVRALCDSSGALARFHGGRPGIDLPLEALTQAENSALPLHAQVMGYLRMSEGESLVIADAAPSPDRSNAATAHASALAFEFSHAGVPLVVNSGNGQGFGSEAESDSRRCPAHSTIVVGERCFSTERAGRSDRENPSLLTTGDVTGRSSRDQSGPWVMMSSGAYEASLGLTIERRLHLTPDGLKLSGEDTVLATRARARSKVAKAFPDPSRPCPFAIRFHLHPDVKASKAMNGRAVLLKLPDGSRWAMTADADSLTLETSRYFDERRPQPRATSQIVARSDVLEYWGRVTWSLERFEDGISPLKARARDGI